MQHQNFTKLFATASTVAAFVFATPVHAQTGPAEADKSHFTLGVAAAYVPHYEGADSYKTRAVPMINYRNGRFFAGALGGIGYNFSPVQTVEFGPVLSYRFGREESDSALLHGLGDIEAGADLGAFVRWNLRPLVLHATVKQGLGADAEGAQLNVGAAYQLPLGASDQLILDASVSLADSRTMQTYFGVNATQSLRSGLHIYTPDAGIRRYGLSALWNHSFNRQWFSTVGVTTYQLGDEAAKSPITVEKSNVAVSMGIGYRF